MRIFITGIGGFIGSSVADALVECGYEVAGVDNFETGRNTNIPGGVRVVTGDLADKETVNFMHGFLPDVIVHTAASYKDPTLHGKHIRTNTIGTALITEIAKISGARVIYFQTTLCYGTVTNMPIKVTQPINPESSYAISKTAGESYLRHSGVDYVSFRLANVYGPRNLSGPIPTFYRNITEGKLSIIKNTRRDFVYIEDLVRDVMIAIDGEGMGVFHISTGESYPIEGIYNAVAANLGKRGKYEKQPADPDDVPDLVLEPSSFFPLPSTPFEEGIRNAVEWYKKNPIKETFTHLRNRNLR
jgi:UDP-glucose 4-epimerase